MSDCLEFLVHTAVAEVRRIMVVSIRTFPPLKGRADAKCGETYTIMYEILDALTN